MDKLILYLGRRFSETVASVALLERKNYAESNGLRSRPSVRAGPRAAPGTKAATTARDGDHFWFGGSRSPVRRKKCECPPFFVIQNRARPARRRRFLWAPRRLSGVCCGGGVARAVQKTVQLGRPNLVEKGQIPVHIRLPSVHVQIQNQKGASEEISFLFQRIINCK